MILLVRVLARSMLILDLDVSSVTSTAHTKSTCFTRAQAQWFGNTIE